MTANPGDKIEAVKGIGKASDLDKDALKTTQSTQSNKDHFDALMAKDVPAKIPPPQIEAAAKPSPMEELRNLNNKVEAISKASPEEIRTKAQQIVSEIEEINKKYSNYSNAKVTPAYNNLLKNRLAHIDDALRIALSKAGLEHQSPVAQAAGTNPIGKFLGYLTHGQYQLEHLGTSINALQSKGMNITPADMLLIQVKLNQVQQELEFVTNALNKLLESVKTLMNVQV